VKHKTDREKGGGGIKDYTGSKALPRLRGEKNNTKKKKKRKNLAVIAGTLAHGGKNVSRSSSD